MKTILSTLLCCITFFLLIRVSELSSIDEDQPFRMRKINLVWLKAKRLTFGKERLNEIFVELQRQDKDERKLKHKKAEGLDKDGEMEATISQNFARIMEKYGLGSKDNDDSNSSDKMYDMESNRVKKSPHIRDERLDKLWQTAVEGDEFDKHELEELRKELDHHHEKWKQYHSLVGLVYEQEKRNENFITKNTENTADTLDKLRDEMDIKQVEVNNNYQRLKIKVNKGVEEQDFKDHRVIELWNRAKAQKLSEVELSIMKEQLKHFDHKIAKHDDLQEQLDVAEDLLSKGHDHIKQKHETLSSKVKEHKRYIKKFHVTLMDKVGPRNEL